MWVNDPTPLIHSTKKSSSNSFPYRASRATMGRWSSWILAANERRMASLMVWKTCYPTAIPGLESYPCSTMLNTVKTHLQLNFMRHVPGLHHLTTRYKLSFLALIYNLIKKTRLAIISLLTTKASACILSILKKTPPRDAKKDAAEQQRPSGPGRPRTWKGQLQGFL